MDSFLSNLVPIIIVGLSLGSLFGLVGLAYTVIINATQLVNFGQGDFAMVGVAVSWAVMTKLGLPLWVAFPLGVLAGGAMGFLTNAAIVTPLLKKDVHPFYPVLGTMSVGTVAAGAVGVFTGFYWMPIEHFLGNEPLKLGGDPDGHPGAPDHRHHHRDRHNLLVSIAQDPPGAGAAGHRLQP